MKAAASSRFEPLRDESKFIIVRVSFYEKSRPLNARTARAGFLNINASHRPYVPRNFPRVSVFHAAVYRSRNARPEISDPLR